MPNERASREGRGAGGLLGLVSLGKLRWTTADARVICRISWQPLAARDRCNCATPFSFSFSFFFSFSENRPRSPRLVDDGGVPAEPRLADLRNLIPAGVTACFQVFGQASRQFIIHRRRDNRG